MKTLFLILLLLITGNLISYSQMSNGNYGNKWINYQNTYYKFKVAEDGVRINSKYNLQKI